MDKIFRFHTRSENMLGSVVVLEDSLATILTQHQYPIAIGSLLSEVLCCTALVRSCHKQEGQLIVQIQNDKPIDMLVAKCDHDYQISGVCRFDEQTLGDQVRLSQGLIVISLVAKKQANPYQSLVPYHGETVCQALNSYYALSEQIDTHFYFQQHDGFVVGGMIQKMPQHESDACDDEYDAMGQAMQALLSSVQPATLEKDIQTHFDLNENVLHSHDVCFQCSCSLKRMTDVLMQMGEEEARSILDEHQLIDVRCDFCNYLYSFDEEAISQIFSQPIH